MIDPYRIMNYRAAKKAWREQGRLSTWEFMEGARIKAAKTPSEWEALTGIKREYKGKISATTRRWAVALIIIILFSSFMAFTVPGRALAKQLYEVFTTFVGNMLHVSIEPYSNAEITAPQAELEATGERSDHSLEQAYSDINRPLAYLKNDCYVLDSIDILVTKSTGTSYYATYLFDDVVIRVKQLWPVNGDVLDYNLLLENASYRQINTNAGFTFNGAYTSRDHNYFGCALINDATIYISIDNVYGWNEINKILEDIDLYYNNS